ncbi:5-methyltetrahydropteroyltriglutamate--homocysteine methyltransferase [Devosia enhydra]|uniref:5-methyltetrahydropteroyltriglutamate--homocysteine methyltransferase n=1 Tax=Devosia enhydra TaxID=665118 RepID=A0A1K2I326_9HYPH|nr:5-methyltetrahydropteroyltriglutamate--homocysteine S-methyltransferase [Devosia enhydra]SFZ86794.1 5-methyltetrahydropteroyltriglutamate--homocysteine methyltransferase [Devosia enhydra]
MAITPPPYRADHVGSLLRPSALKAARKQAQEGKIGPDELKAIEDEAIKGAIKLQQDAGLKAVTDGEFRRAWWHFDFMGMLDGLDIIQREGGGIQFHGVVTKADVPVITDRLDFPDNHPMLEHFRFVAANTAVTPKISIPGPSCVHFRVAAEDVEVKAYRDDIELYFSDIAKTYNKAVKAFYAAGCRYLQMDDIFFAYLCDPKIRAAKKEAGIDPDWLIGKYAWMMHEAIADRPDDMLIGMHMCRGNFKSTWVAEGAYDPAADAIFNQTGVDIYFMEYDTDRAGGLEPLRLLPKGKKRVLPGFITTKVPDLEPLEDLKRKFELAGKYADLDQLGIAPQCGFASTEEGNNVTEDDQKRKLDLVVRTAEAIWGEV